MLRGCMLCCLQAPLGCTRRALLQICSPNCICRSCSSVWSCLKSTAPYVVILLYCCALLCITLFMLWRLQSTLSLVAVPLHCCSHCGIFILRLNVVALHRCSFCGDFRADCV